MRDVVPVSGHPCDDERVRATVRPSFLTRVLACWLMASETSDVTGWFAAVALFANLEGRDSSFHNPAGVIR